MSEARAHSDVVVVSAHCREAGAEEELPPDFLVTFAHACVDAGADVFAGQGPHLMRGGEVYNGMPIFSSLSNFLLSVRLRADDAGRELPVAADARLDAR